MRSTLVNVNMILASFLLLGLSSAAPIQRRGYGGMPQGGSGNGYSNMGSGMGVPVNVAGASPGYAQGLAGAAGAAGLAGAAGQTVTLPSVANLQLLGAGGQNVAQANANGAYAGSYNPLAAGATANILAGAGTNANSLAGGVVNYVNTGTNSRTSTGTSRTTGTTGIAGKSGSNADCPEQYAADGSVNPAYTAYMNNLQANGGADTTSSSMNTADASQYGTSQGQATSYRKRDDYEPYDTEVANEESTEDSIVEGASSDAAASTDDTASTNNALADDASTNTAASTANTPSTDNIPSTNNAWTDTASPDTVAPADYASTDPTASTNTNTQTNTFANAPATTPHTWTEEELKLYSEQGRSDISAKSFFASTLGKQVENPWYDPNAPPKYTTPGKLSDRPNQAYLDYIGAKFGAGKAGM